MSSMVNMQSELQRLTVCVVNYLLLIVKLLFKRDAHFKQTYRKMAKKMNEHLFPLLCDRREMAALR